MCYNMVMMLKGGIFMKRIKIHMSKKLIITLCVFIFVFLSWFIGTHTIYTYDDGIGDVFKMHLNWNTGKLYIHEESTYDISDSDNQDNIQKVETENEVALTLDEMLSFKKAKKKNKENAIAGLSMMICADEVTSANDSSTYRDAANELWLRIINEEPYSYEEETEETEIEDFNEELFKENETYINNFLVKYGFDPVNFDDENETPSEQIEKQIKEHESDKDCKDCKLTSDEVTPNE